eukprot:1960617-Amphidinium_carterae.1
MLELVTFTNNQERVRTHGKSTSQAEQAINFWWEHVHWDGGVALTFSSEGRTDACIYLPRRYWPPSGSCDRDIGT